ncbi:MAG TPA: alpha/beta hydrolase [Actinomycetota bacterium]|nr:alpha/beta hydrolase [Actinomycetota bacterium]
MSVAGSRFVEVDRGRLYVEEAGVGPAVVFLHPGLWDSRTWDPQFASFAERYGVLRLDARGYGRSSRPEPGVPYSHARDLLVVLDDAGIERAALVGCSMGGATAIDFTLVHPDRVAALVLAAAGPSGFEGTPEEEAAWEAWWAERDAPVDAAVEAGDLERAQDLRLATMWAQLGTDDEGGRRIREIAFDNLHELTMDESTQIRLDPSAFSRLGEIAVPTLVLPADHDPPEMEPIALALAERIPDARLVRIPETDHVINLRRPDEFDRVVLEFLGEIL